MLRQANVCIWLRLNAVSKVCRILLRLIWICFSNLVQHISRINSPFWFIPSHHWFISSQRGTSNWPLTSEEKWAEWRVINSCSCWSRSQHLRSTSQDRIPARKEEKESLRTMWSSEGETVISNPEPHLVCIVSCTKSSSPWFCEHEATFCHLLLLPPRILPPSPVNSESKLFRQQRRPFSRKVLHSKCHQTDSWA